MVQRRYPEDGHMMVQAVVARKHIKQNLTIRRTELTGFVMPAAIFARIGSPATCIASRADALACPPCLRLPSRLREALTFAMSDQ
jgi:hypothetical protein